MRLHRSLAGVLLAALLLIPAGGSAQVSAPIASSQLQNLGQLKDTIKAYYQNGSYTAEVAAIAADAQRYIDQRLAAGVKKPALVLDVDDTALLTEGYEIDHDFGYDPDSWAAYAVKPGFPAIGPILALSKYANSKSVAVFFITGRRVAQTDLTTKTLTDVGYTFVHAYLRPPDDHAPSVAPFKTGARTAIERDGYTVLESIGDQWSDLEGGHAERIYKLPNPMYFIP
jgi:predicted secreted acid phosphatase